MTTYMHTAEAGSEQMTASVVCQLRAVQRIYTVELNDSIYHVKKSTFQ